MDKLAQYRGYVQKVLLDYAEFRKPTRPDDELALQAIFDPKRDRYQLIYVGWYQGDRVYGPVLQLDIINGKIWLQLNGTEDDITQDLMELGVPRQDIVLGFHSPYMRQFTDFAVC